MERRSFIKKTTALASVAGLGSVGLNAMSLISEKKIDSKPAFNLNYAPHIGMFKNHSGENPIDEINFMANQGFTAFEDNEMRNRPVELQKKMGECLLKNNIKMGVFVAHKIYWNKPSFASGDSSHRKEFLTDIINSVEVAKRVNATWMTVVPGHLDLRLDLNYQTANVVESLKYASEILEKNNLVMVLEPLNFYNHPGLFLTESPQAFQICKSVNSPSCKILFDIYHQQIQEGNLLPNIEKTWDEIAYFQIGDNPGRNEPTTGEINYKNIFKFIHSKGYKGILGMEHGNSLQGKEGELAVIDAYIKTDDFLN
ncbi:hydroxypyruvate isomerase family protein [Lutibacter flavus]|uniref:Hydroxypyruvate isomerase n=1 Tax=Lutibacter flavus TaxID=691689 RepID=A0A238X9L1_9FLAO|nr:TIM barrel protein [Lutibacter flavus]SNR55400.1 hydroxypyruvate isomerase [Lutibacter flavus]